MNQKYQKALRNVLLAFVLITIGFALGKESAQRRIAAAVPAGSGNSTARPVADAKGQTKVLVYYAHTTFRCVTCNTIEALTQKTLKRRFGDESAAGVVEWRVVNFQEDD